MCAIVGAVMRSDKNKWYLNSVLAVSRERGRDSHGGVWLTQDGVWAERQIDAAGTAPGAAFTKLLEHKSVDESSFIAHLRAEPTHEYVKEKRTEDVQPYEVGDWIVAHNGTIANDRQLFSELSEGIIKRTTTIDSEMAAHLLHQANPAFTHHEVGRLLFNRVRGSFAFLIAHAQHPGQLIAVTNYKPLHYRIIPDEGIVIASQARYLQRRQLMENTHAVPAYSAALFSVWPEVEIHCASMRAAYPIGYKMRALVVCSGGLDSTVAAASLLDEGCDVTLLHYVYGSRADGREIQALKAVASALGVPYVIRVLDLGIDPSDSPLLNFDRSLSRGEAGAEFAHEWVPARNLVMLAHATAYAEAKGFDSICLGNNLEESNSHPDNEMEFINRFNALLPFSVGVGRDIRVEMPVGHLMKREIIQLGDQLKAPLEHTYSCYEGRQAHCGKCASCYLRRAAFKIAGIRDFTDYETAEEA
jgi:7-cyano-7-deazaguanine synthase